MAWNPSYPSSLSTEGLGPRHGEVRRAHQMLNAALEMTKFLSSVGRKVQLNQR